MVDITSDVSLYIVSRTIGPIFNVTFASQVSSLGVATGSMKPLFVASLKSQGSLSVVAFESPDSCFVLNVWSFESMLAFRWLEPLIFIVLMSSFVDASGSLTRLLSVASVCLKSLFVVVLEASGILIVVF